MKRKMSMSLFAATLCVALSGIAQSANADANLHSLVGTMTACGCQCFVAHPAPSTPNPPCGWICFAEIKAAEPWQHFSTSNPASITVELVEQAVGQCSLIQPLLPRKVEALFWLEAAGYDFIYEIIRSPVRNYYLFDLGSP